MRRNEGEIAVNRGAPHMLSTKKREREKKTKFAFKFSQALIEYEPPPEGASRPHSKNNNRILKNLVKKHKSDS